MDNADIDAHIATLKAALIREGIKQAVFDPTKLAQNNRSGRKLMQAYFRQMRGPAFWHGLIGEAARSTNTPFRAASITPII
ncbi:hypothetical protein LJR234_006752 [Mesorhizobium amorphae]|uniref:hypothetical protein n=1 Tax=Mesorhizobium amorphae TaxID=71433 RepID=UPI003ED00B45